MDELNIILKKLEDQDKTLAKIQELIIQIPVQDNKIKNLQVQMDALFRKYDEMYGPQGTITLIIAEQSTIKSKHSSLLAKHESCQVKSLATQVKILWVAILGMAVGIITKLFNS